MRVLIALVTVLFSDLAWGGDLRLLGVDAFALEFYQLADHRDPYFAEDAIAGEQWYGGVATQFDLTIAKYGASGLYWRNRVHSEGSRAQVRQVGWQYELGLGLGPFDAYWHHHSQHLLDAAPLPDAGRFPLDNWMGVRINFVR